MKALLISIITFFSFSFSAAASNSGGIILHNLTGRSEPDGQTIQADLIFSLLSSEGELVKDEGQVITGLELNGREIENFLLTDTSEKNIHYIFVFLSQSDEVLRQVITFVGEQNEEDRFSLAGFSSEQNYTNNSLSQAEFGQTMLDYFFDSERNQNLSDNLIQGMMLARQSQAENQAILVINDEEASERQNDLSEVSVELGEITAPPFYAVPVYYLTTSQEKPDAQFANFIRNSGGKIINSEIIDINQNLTKASENLHSKSLIRFETQINESVNILRFSVFEKEQSNAVEMFFTWAYQGENYEASIKESDEISLISALKNDMVQISWPVFNFVRFSSVLTMFISLAGFISLLFYPKKDRKKTDLTIEKQIVSEIGWNDSDRENKKTSPSLRILQSESDSMIGRLVFLNKARTSVGRGKKNDIVLKLDKNLLETQIIFTNKDGYVYAEEISKAGFNSNMDSPTFGSFLNNSRLGSQPVMLGDGDIIRLGPTVVLEFRNN